jgi:gamma-glutamyltranspeptidase/glutathione hydrolase
MLNHLHLGMPLDVAVAHPRLHVELFQGESTAAHEPGVDVSRVGDEFRPRPFGAPSMYFGGTHAAAWAPDTGLEATADPRRAGGTAVAG